MSHNRKIMNRGTILPTLNKRRTEHSTIVKQSLLISEAQRSLCWNQRKKAINFSKVLKNSANLVFIQIPNLQNSILPQSSSNFTVWWISAKGSSSKTWYTKKINKNNIEKNSWVLCFKGTKRSVGRLQPIIVKASSIMRKSNKWIIMCSQVDSKNNHRLLQNKRNLQISNLIRCLKIPALEKVLLFQNENHR